MQIFEMTLALLVAAVMLSGIARRLRVPYPALLALGGAGLAFWPQLPSFALDPELALAIFVAPVLLDAAFDTSLRELKENWLPIGGLVVVAVIVTTFAVALAMRLMHHDMPWAAALALGAIIAPPDAAAAIAVLRNLRLPYRLLVILEGESLLNDATALLIYRCAVAAATGYTLTTGHLLDALILAVIGSLLAGFVLAWVMMLLTARITAAPSAIVTQFVSTFGVWLLAERLHLSAVLTVVVYGITLARHIPQRIPARLRVPAYAVWETAVFGLNVLAFLLVGLQLRPIWERLSQHRGHSIAMALIVLAVAILARFAWVMPYNWLIRWKIRKYGVRNRRPMTQPTLGSGLIISWCGMRGIVTLAAALALPDGREGTPLFPYRDEILLCAFVTVLGTLVLQGFSLRPIIHWLKLRDDDTIDVEQELARTAALHAALAALENDHSPQAQRVKREYEEALLAIVDAPLGQAATGLSGDDPRRRAVAAGRSAVNDLRNNGTIGDEAFHRMEEYLDWAELAAGGNE